jgi:hypothetical protein
MDHVISNKAAIYDDQSVLLAIPNYESGLCWKAIKTIVDKGTPSKGHNEFFIRSDVKVV